MILASLCQCCSCSKMRIDECDTLFAGHKLDFLLQVARPIANLAQPQQYYVLGFCHHFCRIEGECEPWVTRSGPRSHYVATSLCKKMAHASNVAHRGLQIASRSTS